MPEGTPRKTDAKVWLQRIADYRSKYREWEETGKKVVKRYRQEKALGDEGRSRNPALYNVLFSNVQTLRPALFSQTPAVVAERRHKDKDPVGRLAAQIIERLSNHDMERSGFRQAFDSVVLDVLLPGRGVPWVRFDAGRPAPPVPVTPQPGPDGSVAMVAPDGNVYPLQAVSEGPNAQLMAQPEENIDEHVVVDYVHWRDFAHSLDRNWADVMRRGWVARRVAMTRKEGRQRFGKAFSKVKMSMSSRMMDDQTEQRTEAAGSEDNQRFGEVWEVWDAESRKRLMLAEGVDEPLEVKDDPYLVEGFFPCPRPAFASLSNEDLIPTPDYMQYVGQAEELDEITGRIRRLTEGLKVVGLYDHSQTGLATMLQSADNTMVPVEGMQDIVAKGAGAGGGLNGVLQWMPVADVANALSGLYAARDQIKALIYEVSGVSDIVRGSVDPREKAAQSRIKANFAGQRLEQRRMSVARCARDAAAIAVEVALELYSDQAIRQVSGFDFLPEMADLEPPEREQAWSDALTLLRDDKLRGMRVDIETDSTVSLNQEQSQERRTEFLNAVGGFLNNALGVMQASPDLVPVMGELLLFTARGFRTGRTLESKMEEGVDAMRARVQASEEEQQGVTEEGQPPPDGQPPAEGQPAPEEAPPDPAMEAQMALASAEVAKAQAEAQRAVDRAAFEKQKQALELQKLMAEAGVAPPPQAGPGAPGGIQ